MRRAKGVCHVCQIRDRLPDVLRYVAGDRGAHEQPIRYCHRCGHWFCEECWGNVMGRLTGFIEQYVKGAPAGCCGPKEE